MKFLSKVLTLIAIIINYSTCSMQCGVSYSQLPLLFGDGTTNDFSFEVIESNTDYSVIYFGGSGYSSSSSSSLPVLAAYDLLTSDVYPRIKWIKYFSSSSISNVKAIGFSPYGSSRLVVGF